MRKVKKPGSPKIAWSIMKMPKITCPDTATRKPGSKAGRKTDKSLARKGIDHWLALALASSKPTDPDHLIQIEQWKNDVCWVSVVLSEEIEEFRLSEFNRTCGLSVQKSIRRGK